MCVRRYRSASANGSAERIPREKTEYVASRRIGSRNCRPYGGLLSAHLAGQAARGGRRFSPVELQLGSVEYLAGIGADDGAAGFISSSASL